MLERFDVNKYANVKLFTWNCNGAFRKKVNTISHFEADIFIIQECENPDLSLDQAYKAFSKNSFWIGDNKHKGLGVFARDHIKLEKINWSSADLQYFIPCRINNEFNLLACWCHGAKFKSHKYIGQLWKYMQLHKFKFGPAIIIGDLNANVFWDKPSRNWNHSDVVHELIELNIHSLYHQYFDEAQGDESQPTFYLYKHLDKPYHMDYVFVHDQFITPSATLHVGRAEDWIKYSDHMPLVVHLPY